MMPKKRTMRSRVERAVDSPLPTQRSNEPGRAVGDSRHTDSGVEELARCYYVGRNECCCCILFGGPSYAASRLRGLNFPIAGRLDVPKSGGRRGWPTR